MRFTAFLAAGVAACTTPAPPPDQGPTEAVRHELIAARDAVWRAWFAGDSARLVALLPDPMTGMGKSRDAIIADAIGFRTGGGTLTSLSFTDDEFLVRGEMALLLSHYLVVTATNGEPDTLSGRATEVFTFDAGRWRNPYWHLHE